MPQVKTYELIQIAVLQYYKTYKYSHLLLIYAHCVHNKSAAKQEITKQEVANISTLLSVFF